MEALLAQDPAARRKALEDAYYKTAEADIDYSADRTLREVLESQNAKNMLYSTATGDYFVEPVERARMMGKERARQTAFTTAGRDVRDEQLTQAQLLGQSFNIGTAGLTTEAGVEAANRNANQAATQAGYTLGSQLGENAATRAQQESQFGRSLAETGALQREGRAQQESQFGRSLAETGALQREGFANTLSENAANRAQMESQFGRSLGQTGELTRESFTNARDIASNTNLVGGLAGGISGLASLFGPQGLGRDVLHKRFPDVFG